MLMEAHPIILPMTYNLTSPVSPPTSEEISPVKPFWLMLITRSFFREANKPCGNKPSNSLLAIDLSMYIW